MYLTLAWRNVWRNKRRTIITMSSIGFAVFFACVMQSMQMGVYERMIDNTVRFSTGHLQIHSKGFWDEKVIDNSMQWNGNEDLSNLPALSPKIQALAPRLESFALASYGDKTKGVMVVGIDPEKEEQITQLSSKLEKGTYFKNGGVQIGKDLAAFLELGVGDTLVLISQGYHGVSAAGKFVIDGIMKFPNPAFNQQGVFMRLPEAQYFYGAESLITSLSILLESSDDVIPVQQRISSNLEMEEYEVMTWEEMMPELVQGIELDYYGGLVMIMILYAVIAFGIFGTFLMMTKERNYEFGILTAVGMKKFKIQWMVFIEIIMLTALGVLAGVLVGMPLLTYFYYNPIYLSGEIAKVYENFGFEAIIPFSLQPSIFVRQGVIVLTIAMLLGAYPMYAIQSLKTVKALRE
ncbi:MAG: ABC transporter permease [Cyclobacteriaceae bacterium]